MLSLPHLFILAVIVVVIFGTAKLRNVGRDLGGAVRDFKKGLAGDEEDKPSTSEAERQRADMPPTAQSTSSQHDTVEQK